MDDRPLIRLNERVSCVPGQSHDDTRGRIYSTRP
jgi:hypothetical protein